MTEESMTKSTEVNHLSPSEFTLENLRDKPLITDKSEQTSATFDYLLADSLWYRVDGTLGEIITIYVDVSKTIGDMKVTHKEFRHIEMQLEAVEDRIDPVTGNAFDIIVTTDTNHASNSDIRLFKTESMRENYDDDSVGIWHPGEMNLIYQHDQRGGKEHSIFDYIKQTNFSFPSIFGSTNQDSNLDYIKETLSHEIGHIFGLHHPLDSLEDREYFSDTIMNCCEGYTATFLTEGDLELLAYGWEHTFDHMYSNVG